MIREVVILTRSSKYKGYCVAGIDINTGEWVRFVSGNKQAHGALSAYDITFEDGQICKPLDLVSVEVTRAVPLPHQPENILINSRMYWEKIGKCTLYDVLDVHPSEGRPYIYGDTYPYINKNKIANIRHSLTLVHVSYLTIRQILNSDNRRKTKANFLYNGNWYNYISVTAPDFYSVPDGTRYDEAYLVVSLPDTPLSDGLYYKFIANIYPI